MLFDKDEVKGDIYAENGKVVFEIDGTQTIMTTKMSKQVEMKLSEARQEVHEQGK